MNITCQNLETLTRLLADAYQEIGTLNGKLEECQGWNRQASEKLMHYEEQNGTGSSQPLGAVEFHGDGSRRRGTRDDL